MNTEPYGTTTFCDDIRHEINGKLTLVGCYASTLSFDGPPPGLLPNFAALINVRVPTSIDFKVLTLHVVKIVGTEEEQILEVEIPNSESHNQPSTVSDSDKNPESKVTALIAPCQWTQLSFANSGKIKVRATLDEDIEIRLGTLEVNFSKHKDGERTESLGS